MKNSEMENSCFLIYEIYDKEILVKKLLKYKTINTSIMPGKLISVTIP